MAPLAEAFVRVRADTSSVRDDVRKDFDRAGADAGDAFGARFSRDAQGRLRDERGNFVAEGRKLGDSTGGGFNVGFGNKLRGSGGLGDIAGRVFDLLTPRLSGLSGGLGGLAGGFGAATSAAGGLLSTGGKLAGSLATVTTAAVGVIAQLGKLAVAAGAMATLAAGAASAASGTVSLAAALAPAVGIIGALPGAVAGFIAVNGVLKLSLYAVSDAMKAAYDNDAKAFEKAFNKLTPAAQNFAIEFRNLVPAMKEFQRAAQDGFFGELNGKLGGFLDLLKSTQPFITTLASETGKWAGELATFATAEKSVNQFNDILAHTRLTLQGLRDALQPILGGFLDLAVVGAEFFHRISGGIADAGIKFGAWLSLISESGKAMEWMNNAVVVFKALGGIAQDVGGILKAIFKAAETAGTGALGIIGQLADKFNKFLNSGKGQDTLVTIFQSLQKVGEALTPVIGALGDGLALIAPKVAAIAVAFGPALVAAVNAVAPALAALAPGLIAISGALASAFASQAVRDGLLALGQGISRVLIAASPLIPIVANLALTLLNALLPAVATLGPGLVAIGQALVTAFSNPVVAAALLALGQGIANVLIAVAPLIPPLVELAAILVSRLGNSLTTLAALLAPVISALADVLAPILPVLAQLFAQVSAMVLPLAQQLGGILGDALRQIGALLAPLIQQFGAQFSGALAQLMPVLQPVIDALREVGTQVLRAILAVLPQITPHLGTLAGAFAALLVEVIKILPSLIRFGGEILVALIQQLPVLAPMMVELALAFLDIFKQVTPLIPPLLKLLLAVVLPLIPELPKLLPPFIELARIFADLFEKYSPLIKKLLESPAALAAVKSLAANGVLALNTLRDGLNLALGAAQTFIGVIFGMPDQVNAGMSRMGGAIKSWINAVIGWFESLMNSFAGIIPGLPRVSLPRLANGAVVDRRTIAMVGEAGPEVVIPLTRPARAMQLARESGLMDILASQMQGVASAFAVPPLSSRPALVGAGAAPAGFAGGGRGDRNLTIQNVNVQDGNMQRFASDLHIYSLGEW